MSDAVPVSRRERLRAEALMEIREHGYEQIARGGAAALSLNGIAKAMGMSGPAMYRYFASRDELLATLVAESYAALAAALEDAAHGARRRAPAGRFQAVADAYRTWAVAEPHRYRLVFGTAAGAGIVEPERVVPAAHRSMEVFLDALSDAEAARVPDATLRRELTAWVSARAADGPAAAPETLLTAVTAWTRVHGIVSLEIEGFFASMGLDAGRLYAEEVRRITAAAAPPAASPRKR